MSTTSAATLADHLLPVTDSLAPLVADGAVRDLAAVAGRLPGALTTTFGFECRLGPRAAPADLLVSLRGERGRRGLAALVAASEDPGTRRLKDFAEAWAGPGSPLHTAVDNLWLEFDVDGRTAPAPSVFFGFPPSDPGPAGSGRAGDRSRNLAATRTALALLTGAARTPDELQALRRCFQTPFGAEVFQVGMMLSRTPALVRLCLRLRTADEVLPVLRQVGWRGDEESLRRTLEPVAAAADYVCLDLDVGEQVLAKVGLECYATGREQWRRLVDVLGERGLCTAEQGEVLLAYPGHRVQDPSDGRWPSGPAAATRLLGARSTSLLARSLHHVKVVHRPDDAPEAKAYLAVNYRWVTPEGVVEE